MTSRFLSKFAARRPARTRSSNPFLQISAAVIDPCALFHSFTTQTDRTPENKHTEQHKRYLGENSTGGTISRLNLHVKLKV